MAKTMIRKRKTERVELPEINEAGFREFKAWKDDCAAALGQTRPNLAKSRGRGNRAEKLALNNGKRK